MKTFGHRQSMRLQGFDYSQPGAYFVTVCVQDRECLFGDVVNGKRVLNDSGQMIDKIWNKLPERFPEIRLNEYMTMPNHFHGIVMIFDNRNNVGANPRVRPDYRTTGQTHGSAPTLGCMIQWFKTMTTNAYIRGVKQNNWPPFLKKLWQRNYHEHVIRNEKELFETRQYIQGNPKQWEIDPENPYAKT